MARIKVLKEIEYRNRVFSPGRVINVTSDSVEHFKKVYGKSIEHLKAAAGNGLPVTGNRYPVSGSGLPEEETTLSPTSPDTGNQKPETNKSVTRKPVTRNP